MKNQKIITPKLCILAFSFAVFSLVLIGCSKGTRSYSSRHIRTSTAILLPQAEQIIIDALADENPLIRTKSIEVIASTRQIRLMPKVVRLLTDEAVPVRYSAVLAIGDTQYQLAEKTVKQLLKDDEPNIRIATAYAMYKLGHTEQIQIIQKAITDKNQTLRANATVLLGKSEDKNSLKLLYWVMQDRFSEHKVSLQAAQAIAKLGDEKIFPKLWSMLISSFADDRIMGVRAMGSLGTPEAKNALITMLDDSILEIRLASAEQLGTLNDNIGEPEVLDVFQNKVAADMDRQSRQRVYVLTAMGIGQIRTESLTKFLPMLLKDSSKLVRIAASKAVFMCTNDK